MIINKYNIYIIYNYNIIYKYIYIIIWWCDKRRNRSSYGGPIQSARQVAADASSQAFAGESANGIMHWVEICFPLARGSH